MKTEDKVTSLELSKQLVDAGIVVGDSLFIWATSICLDGEPHVSYNQMSGYNAYSRAVICPAPLPCELLDILPVETQVCKRSYGFLSGIQLEHYRFWTADTAADALAKMALWLKAEGLLEQPQEERK